MRTALRPIVATASPDAGGIALRLARDEDRGFIVDLCARTFADLGDYRETVTSWLDGSQTLGIVAGDPIDRLGVALLAARRAIGFGRRPTAELLAIALVPAARGRGIGRLLLGRAERVACAWDASEMRLHTADSNERAQRFFTAAGYALRPSGTSAYPSGETAIAYVRSLR